MVRDAMFMAAARVGLVQRVLAPLLSQLDVDYGEPDNGPVWRRRPVHAGHRAPVFAPALDRDAYTVLLWPGRNVARDWASTCADARRKLAGRAQIVDLAGVSTQASGALRRCFGSSPLIAAVRPDGHLAQLAGVHRPDEILRFLQAARIQ